MKINVGPIDRIVRYTIAAALIIVGLFVLDGIHGETVGIVVAVLSLLPITTATTRSCPAYSILGISTCGQKTPDAQTQDAKKG